jgi:putative transcriptional regulator
LRYGARVAGRTPGDRNPDNVLLRQAMRRLHLLVLALALCATSLARAQQHDKPNGLFLIAKPSLSDPNFRRTVVLVTQTPDASTVGVIVNRPTRLRLSQFLTDEFATQNYRAPLYFGGPVMRQAIVALLRSESAPPHAAFHVLKDVYLTMHADNIQKLLAEPGEGYRLYAGFSGWAPRQLESELAREDWYVLPADAASLFRKDTEGLWEELVRKATRPGPQTRAIDRAGSLARAN